MLGLLDKYAPVSSEGSVGSPPTTSTSGGGADVACFALTVLTRLCERRWDDDLGTYSEKCHILDAYT